MQYESRLKKRNEKIKSNTSRKDNQGALRRETWIHPEDGSRIHRTAPLKPMTEPNISSDEEELKQIDSIEVNFFLIHLSLLRNYLY